MIGDDDVSSAVDDAITAGGSEQMYKDLERKAAGFRGVEDQRDIELGLKAQRRDAARRKRVSLRDATERAARRTGR